MTTERALPVPPEHSPSPSKYTFPSPVKPDPNLKPNPHPYAVKTTTSGLLTRSNSSGHNVEATRHYYVPLSPNASRSPDSAKGHKASMSLNSVAECPTRSPRPLPVPPGFSSANTSPVHGHDPSLNSYDADISLHRRNKRADTLPSFPSSDVTQALERLAVPDDLPPNPKLWTPSQLSTYLTTALRVTSQAKVGHSGTVPLPVRVAKGIAAFTRSRMINGRMFLRLTEAELESMGMNKKWRELLLSTSQELRQNVLKGRIWGPDIPSNPSPGSTSPLPNMFSNSFYNSSTSSLELSADEGEAKANEVADGPKRSRSGRVRGMVQSFERSGSFSSEASFDEEEHDDSERAKLSRWLREEQSRSRRGSVHDNPLRSPSPVKVHERDLHEAVSVPLPESPPKQHTSVIDEEPSIEVLLAAEPANASATAWGARAWEEMDTLPGVTVKRIPGTVHPPYAAGPEVHGMITGNEHGRAATSGRRKNRDERRVVTAIFAPLNSSPDVVIDNPAVQPEHTVESSEAASQTDLEAPAESNATALEEETRQLEEELAEMRVLVEQFRQRLATVEEKVSELERLEAEREHQQERAVEQAAEEAKLVIVTPGASGAAVRPEPLSSTLLARTAAMLPVAIQRLDLTDRLANADGAGNEEEDDAEPSTLSEFPSYVLLVGFGVCAVVLRVVLRRVAGRNTFTSWRP